MKRLFFSVLIISVLGSGCSKIASQSAYTPTCSGTAKSYKNDVAPIVRSACDHCHAGLSSYSSLVAAQSSVRSVVVSGAMPRDASLSTAQKDAIACWIDNGALNN
jgi:uncharacterized membrane protein